MGIALAFCSNTATGACSTGAIYFLNISIKMMKCELSFLFPFVVKMQLANCLRYQLPIFVVLKRAGETVAEKSSCIFYKLQKSIAC